LRPVAAPPRSESGLVLVPKSMLHFGGVAAVASSCSATTIRKRPCFSTEKYAPFRWDDRRCVHLQRHHDRKTALFWYRKVCPVRRGGRRCVQLQRHHDRTAALFCYRTECTISVGWPPLRPVAAPPRSDNGLVLLTKSVQHFGGAGFVLRQEGVPASASLEKTYRGFVHVDAERLLLCGNLRDAIIPPLPRRASLAVGSKVVCIELGMEEGSQTESV
jgi:hypothetical protein